MSRPVITGSNEPKVMERPRPPNDRLRAHKWLNADSVALYERSKAALDLYLSKIAEEKIRNHALSRLDDGSEVMGFLLGTVHTDNGRTFVMVRDVATTDLDATSVSVRFQRDGFEKLFESLDDTCFHYVLVGWYHSHPGHGCFLSQTDIDTQVQMFARPYHSALVVDPVNRTIATFHLEDGQVKERAFAVYWDEYQNPYCGESVKARKKRSDPNGVPLPQ